VEFRSLSKTEAKVVLSLEAEREDLVTLAGIQKRAGVSSVFARKLAHDLVRRGWLQRVRRGTYLLNPSRHGPEALPDTDPLRVGSRLVGPYYFGYATAAELHGFFPQASRVYYVVTTERYSARGHPTAQFRIVRTKPSLFFGTQTVTRRGESLVVSDPERTVLDCLGRPEFSGGMAGVAEIFALAKPRLDWRRLASYLGRFGNRSLALRAGFLSEHVRPSIRPPSSWVRPSLPSPEEPFVPLGPPSTHGRRGPHDSRWHVIRNVSDAQLFAEGEIR
jgi:predicted transcriptional regulator of viral defense system